MRGIRPGRILEGALSSLAPTLEQESRRAIVEVALPPTEGLLPYMFGHAEIGGLTPGSMPAASRTVHEEGVLFDACPLVTGGRFREEQTRRLLGETNDPIKHVAQQLGYRDVYFFSRQFRQFAGVPPAMYRKSRQG